MRPARIRGGGGGAGFGIPQLRSTAAKLAAAMVVVSLVWKLGGLDFLLLVPGAVLQQVWLWQPLTYTFISMHALGVLFGAIIIWSIGTALESSWGSRRLAMFAIGITVLAGILTVLMSLVLSPLRGIPFGGATVMTSAIWIGYGLSVGRGQSNFWGMPITGNMLAMIGVGFIVLNGAFGSFYIVVPDIFAALMAFAYVRGFSPRILWLRFQSWRLQTQLKGRSKHLRVISRDRNTPADSDRYLH